MYYGTLVSVYDRNDGDVMNAPGDPNIVLLKYKNVIQIKFEHKKHRVAKNVIII